MTGALFAGQTSLPRLPVPPLEQTLKKYLRSTLPHQPSKEALQATKNAVEAALSGADAKTFQTLQQRLLERRDSKDSWLSEWWNEAAYMAPRDPIVPYVNYFYKHQDDRKRRDNVTRASALLKGVLAFRRLVESGQLAPEKTKTGLLCSASYPWLFNSTRLPRKGLDHAVKYPAQSHNHLVVLRNGKYWQFDLVDRATGQELSEKEIQTQLKRILADPEGKSQEEYPIGALTGDDRDKFAQARQDLLAVSPDNVRALEAIQSSVIVLCLDNLSPVTLDEGAWELWTGNGARNRFFDKQQLIVFDNGSSGYNGEHSTMDGTPTLRMNDFILAAVDAGKIDMGTSARSAAELPAPTRITFQLNDGVRRAISRALHDFSALLAKHDLEVLDFQGYGKEAIKAFKCSPDAWVQMAIQLAYYKMYGIPCGTYESAQTRKFLLGRTEVIRSASVESKAFCEAMTDASVSDEQAYEKFQAAVKQHLAYAKDAADAQGVDRHLFGLKKLLRPDERLPALYSDAAFAATSTWKLSTSQISSERFTSWGFGEVTPEGYGCAYAIKADSLTFTLTSLKLSTRTLKHYINEACCEIRDLHKRLATKQHGAAGAKL
ncbi:putative carnitine O-acetyltransferase mitochondrial precursor [Tilletiaria anomala UBC 951]|uniref:Carnitine O-acetyltransferase, mitochondrial n=1 Tax=Tilletiaria anomala (strain ATCC 24038 / CBS 436.72 / UBC 951) TaxID=1037660 RepID=A0A066VA53_TILAU|nr:putative carnitine O-acetyltransferase mitochondrial precursor [Tilletiaria anomala UBC 951]KDN35644.1 putative carnitine O-acetyltransferase mitochondrial precursor [Tilletiaria anomala UBC 951]